MELVSIIMPTYKRDIFLERALKSLINQTYKNIEIIIVDDNFDNEIRRSVEKIIDKYKDNQQIKYIKNTKNIGGAFSRNVGIKYSTGKYIAFLDDDDEYDLNKIEMQYKYYKKKFPQNNGIIYSQSVIYNQKGTRIYGTKTYVEGNKEALYYMMSGNLATTGNLFIPKILIEEVNGFEKLDCGQEWYLIFKILLRGYECKYMKEELLKYYEHTSERITTNYLKKFEGEKKLYEIKKKHMDMFSLKEQNQLNYKINIMLANYAIRVDKKAIIYYLKEASKYKRLEVKDLVKILIKNIFNEYYYNILKKIVLN